MPYQEKVAAAAVAAAATNPGASAVTRSVALMSLPAVMMQANGLVSEDSPVGHQDDHQWLFDESDFQPDESLQRLVVEDLDDARLLEAMINDHLEHDFEPTPDEFMEDSSEDEETETVENLTAMPL